MLSFAYSTNVEKYISKSQLKSGLQYKMFITANRQKKGSGNYNAWFDKVVLWFWVFWQNFLMLSDKCCIVSHFSFNITWLPTMLSYLSAIFFRVFHFWWNMTTYRLLTISLVFIFCLNLLFDKTNIRKVIK